MDVFQELPSFSTETYRTRNSQKTTFWGYMLVHWEKYGEINISGVLVCFKYICAIVRVSPVLHFGPIHEYKPDRRHSI